MAPPGSRDSAAAAGGTCPQARGRPANRRRVPEITPASSLGGGRAERGIGVRADPAPPRWSCPAERTVGSARRRADRQFSPSFLHISSKRRRPAVRRVVDTNHGKPTWKDLG